MAHVLAVVEQRDNTLRKVSREVTSAARSVAQSMNGDAHAVLLGPPGVSAAAPELGRHGAETVWVAESDAFAQYSPDGFAATIEQHIRAHEYFAVLFPASAMGKDLAPRVAARLDVPLATDAIALDVEQNELIITRPVHAGRAFARLSLEAAPRLVSLRPNVFSATEHAAAGRVDTIAVAGSPDDWPVRITSVEATAGAQLDVAEAPIIVSGGRGMKGPDNWHILEELRAALGPTAALGASRAVVDEGWRPHAEQVGQTGKTVSPQLYFAIAISGAMQHLAGMRNSRTIVAVNKDPDAPIFKIADYGIVGDVQEILPALSAAIRTSRGA
ncbi:MAG: electron transfer flavoprotein subunit alpha/FixB family protein [Longimicrobiales bacterium]